MKVEKLKDEKTDKVIVRQCAMLMMHRHGLHVSSTAQLQLKTVSILPITDYRLPITDSEAMKDVYIISDNIISSLGFTTTENMKQMLAGETGIRQWEDQSLSPVPFWASRVDDIRLRNSFSQYADPNDFSRFEQMVVCSVKDALSHTSLDISDKKTLFILSTTKGNIDLLNKTECRFKD